MKITFALLSTTAIAVMFCVSISNTASAATDPTNQLAAIYLKTDSAADHKDIDGCLVYHSPNFLALDSNGKVETTDQQRSRLTKMFDSIGTMDVTTHIDKCDYADKTATVIITQQVKTTMTDPDTGKQVPVSGVIHARELWTNSPSGWQIDVIQTLQAAQLTPDQ